MENLVSRKTTSIPFICYFSTESGTASNSLQLAILALNEIYGMWYCRRNLWHVFIFNEHGSHLQSENQPLIYYFNGICHLPNYVKKSYHIYKI